MFEPSQLDDISRQFRPYIQEVQAFLLHEGFPVQSPDAVHELCIRLRQDLRFRADVSSLMRAALYREREKVSYVDLLGILLLAAVGTRLDLESDSHEPALREILQFLMQTRRSALQPEPEPSADPIASHSYYAPAWAHTERTQQAPAVFDPHLAREIHEAGTPVALPFAGQIAPEAPWWRTHPVSVVGFAGVLLGLGAGLMIRPESARTAGLPLASTAADSGTSTAAGPAPLAANRATASRTSSRKPSPSVPTGLGRRGYAREMGSRTLAASSTPEPLPGSRKAQSTLHSFARMRGSNTASQPAIVSQPNAADAASLRAAFAHPEATRPAPVTARLTPVAITRGGQPPVSGIVPAREGTVRLGSAGIMAANVMFSPAPAYPPAASAARVQGEVKVQAVVDRDGDVIDARVVSGPPLLRDAALEAVQRWRYRPYVQDGKPLAVATTAIVDFQIPQ